MRSVLAVLFVASCGFHVPGGSEIADAPDPSGEAGTAQHRRVLVVTTGAVRPDKGYAGYTVRLVVKRAEIPTVAADCADLRVMHGTTELVHHVASCETEIDLRFALPADVPDSTAWRELALVYGDGVASPPASPLGTAVYLWWDDASRDRKADYVHGRMDQWLATGHDDSLAWNAAGYYTYDTGDDSQSGYRRAVAERDVYVEAAWFHTGCYAYNMQSGVCVRGISLSGSGANELSDHYYCSSRAQNPTCANNDQGLYDGDILKTDNEILAVNNPTDPPPIAAMQWRSQALAAFGTGPTKLRFWDADASWNELAFPPPTALLTSGSDATDYTGRGFAGIMTAQDSGRMRNLVIRRYVEPEPVVTYDDEDAP
jgi:hypothetical protein